MVSCGISTPFGVLFPSKGEVAHALLTRPPLKQPVASYQPSPLDLHVLGTPPAFVLSQDQTLKFDSIAQRSLALRSLVRIGIDFCQLPCHSLCIVFKVRMPQALRISNPSLTTHL